MTIAQALATATALGLDRLDTQLLALHALGRTNAGRAWLLAHDTDALAPEALRHYLALCERRAAGEPLAYIVGRKEFFGLDLQVDARVLVPRPETETLVEWALEVLAAHPGPARPVVVDLGTGSGAIALSIKKSWPDAGVLAIDASAAALEVARLNALRLGLKVEFEQGSWLAGVQGRHDLIVSNPPYVAQADPHLAALSHEPLNALASGPDGLDDIRNIIAQAPVRLRSGGWLLLEHGYDQAPAVRVLLEAAGFQDISSRRDLAGIERCCGARWLELG